MIKNLIWIIFLIGTLNAQQPAEKELNQQLEKLLGSDESQLTAISQTFFQLGQYPWALLYSERALKKSPGNEEAALLKKRSEEKLFVDSSSFEPLISIRASLILFLIFLCLAFLSGSLCLWKKNFLTVSFLTASVIVSFIFLLAAVNRQYFSPLPGVIVEPTAVYRGEGSDFDLVSDRPLYSGMRIGVLDEGKNGQWLKIQTSDGTIGFIPMKKIRII